MSEQGGGFPRVIAYDLDGTVLDHGTLPKRTARTLEKARGLGCVLAVATGRAYAGLKEQIRGLPADYYITSNGARTTQAGRETPMLQTLLPGETARAAVALLRPLGACFELQLCGGALFEREMLRRWTRQGGFSLPDAVRFAGSLRRLRIVPDAGDFLGADGGIEKLSAMLPPGTDIPALCAALGGRFAVEAVPASDAALEMTARGVTKGAALARLCAALGIRREEVVAFGDSGNDLSLRCAAGCFVAVDNAAPAVLAAADAVTGSARAGGVADFLEKYVLGR